MQNRLYTVIDKALFYDPDSILIGAFEFLELNGEDTGSTLEKLRGFYPRAHFDISYDESSGVKTVLAYRRQGRSDRDISELKSVLALLKKTGVEVRSGRMYCFSEGAGQSQIDTFLKENVNAYVYICDIAGSPREAELAQENPIIESFCTATYTELVRMRKKFDLGMAIDDLMCVQNYFISESREPSLVEIKIIDNFFSENFRHTTFETILDSVETEDEVIADAWQHYRELRRDAIPSLSDITKAAKLNIVKENVVQASGKLSGVRVPMAQDEDGLLLLCKNESHNRSTTAVPFDGASGCISGAVKDFLCALGYPYDSYRVVGCGKNEKSRKNAIVSAMGYAETANSVGVSCSKCKEDISHSHDEKQREICAVLALANERNVKTVFEKSAIKGDKVYVVGGKAGADGSHCMYRNLKNEYSVGEYVPVSSPAELAALKRLFVSQELADIAVAINDISSGGVICALGEIADGADINISEMQTKYELSVSEALLSESGERMIVCVRAESGARLESLCKKAGLGCAEIGTINDDKRFVIYDGEGNRVASLTGAFLLSGGAEKHLSATVKTEQAFEPSEALIAAKAPLESVSPIKKFFGRGIKYDFEKACLISAEDIDISRPELSHRCSPIASGDITSLDSSSSKYDVSVCRLSYNGRQVKTADNKAVYSALACGTANGIGEVMPYSGAYLSLVEAVLKLVCAGYGENDINFTLQEYFPEHKNNSTRLGISVASMLGCFEAQMQLGIPSIGGRISIGGGESERERISIVNAFAFCLCEREGAIRKALSRAGSKLVLIKPEVDKALLPSGQAVKELIKTVNALKNSGVLRSAAVVNAQNPATVLMEMCKPDRKGVAFDEDCDIENIFDNAYASVICEISEKADMPKGSILLGHTVSEHRFTRGDDAFELSNVLGLREVSCDKTKFKRYLYLKEANDLYGSVKPLSGEVVRVFMPLTDSSVMHDDVKAAFEENGAAVKLLRINEGNMSELVKQIKKADVLWLSDSVNGDAVLCYALADKKVRAEIDALRERGGLVYGCGSAFEALLISGILGIDTDRLSVSSAPYVNQRVVLRACSALSPFTRKASAANEYKGFLIGKRLKITCQPEYASSLAKEGRILTQYTESTNPTCSDMGIDSVCSADGAVMGQLSRPFGDASAHPIVQSVMGYFLNYK